MSALTILPLTVTIIGAAFAIVILNHYFATKHRPHELVWSVAFILFALAGAAQVLADLRGWTPLEARFYYLAGAILNVAFLGVGTVYLIFPRRVANVALAITLAVTAISIYVIFTAPINQAILGQEAGWKAVAIDALDPKKFTLPRLLAAITNSIGTLLVVGGALWSGFVFWRKRIMKNRMIGVFLLALGTFIVALGGTVTSLTGLNNHDYLYLSMVIGVLVMFIGYLQTVRPAPPARVVERATAPGVRD